MLLLPTILVVAVATFLAYRVLHRGTPLISGGPDLTVPTAAEPRSPLWPTTVEGKIGIGAFALGFLPVALVNVVQVAFFGWAVQLTALVATAIARFVRHDRAVSVLIVLILTAFAVLASLLFVAGEIVIGHD